MSQKDYKMENKKVTTKNVTNKIQKDNVLLKAKDQKNPKPQPFPISQANRLLSLSNSQWELSDEKYQWNGTELAKV